MRRVARALAIASLALPVSVALASQDADAGEPYGGCKEARPAYAASPGADWCRAHGWIIRTRIGVTPRGVIRWNTLPVCDAPEIRRSERHCFVPFHRVAGRQRAYIVDTISPHIVATTMIVRASPVRSDATSV